MSVSMTTNPGYWPCAICSVKTPSFCRTIAPDDILAARLRSNEVRQNHYTAGAGRNVFRPGRSSDDVYVLCEGWAFTHFILPDGRRQIFSFLLPGDIFSCRMMFAKEDYISVTSLTEIRYSRINSSDLQRAIAKSPDLMKNAAKVGAREDQWHLEAAVELGKRSAEERIAHFIVRLTERLDRLAMVYGGSRYPFPIKQSDIADAVGLSSVHVSRVLTKFRKENLIDISSGELVIMDPVELARMASSS
ncbi:MAG: Crp/Fnr family transcriptional regulator [Beijerinckiaceae bacterium]